MWVSSQKNKHGEFQKTHLHIGYRFLFGAGAHPTISIHFPYEGMVHPITLLTCAAPKDGKFEALQGKIMEFNGQANGLFFFGGGGGCVAVAKAPKIDYYVTVEMAWGRIIVR